MAQLHWAVCNVEGCNWVGNSYEDESQANEELNEHMVRHAQAGESGGGVLEHSEG